MDKDAKYNALYDKLCGITEMFVKVLEMYMANMNADDDYLEHPMSSSEQEQTQDREDEQDMYDAQESVEDEEESDQELPDCVPMPCVTLTREYQNLIAKVNGERCLEETSGHTEEAESDEEEEA